MTSNDGWRELCVHEFAEIIGGTTPSTAKPSHFGGDIPWITPKDLSNFQGRYITRGERNLTQDGVDAAGLRILPRGAVLLSTRAPVGYVAIAKNPLTTNQGFRSLVVKHGFEPEFVYYLLRHDTDRLKAFASGTTFGELSGSTLGGLHYHVPPLVEQRSIARVLGSLDDKIELNRRMNQTLEEICRALFKFWFVDFGPVRAKQEGRWKNGESLPGMPADMWDLWPSEFEESDIGEIPRGWRVGPFSSVVEVNPERGLVRGETSPYVEMAQLPTSGARVAGWVARAFASGSRFRNGDTLVARITPCLENGKTAYVDFLPDGQIGWGSTEFLVLCPKRPLPTQWAYLLARTEDFRTHLIQNMSGTSGRQRAPAECLDSFLVTVPSPEVAEHFGSVVAPWFESIKQSDAESATLAATRDTLLPKLLSGEIRVPVERIAAGAPA